MAILKSRKEIDIVHVVVVRDTSNGAIILDCMGAHNQTLDRYRADISPRDFILCLNAIQRISNDGINGVATGFS